MLKKIELKRENYKDNTDEICPICYETILDITILPCGHKLCE